MSNLMKGRALVIHVGDDVTRVACLTLGAKLPQILDCAEFATPLGAVQDGVLLNAEALQAQLALELEQHPEFRKARKAVFVLQSTQVLSQTISVPQIKKKKRVEQLVKTNADLYFPVDITDYQLTWQIVGHTSEDEAPLTRIQLWATPKSVLSPYYLLAADCGLTVAAVDYCGHSFAGGINASFELPRAVKKAPAKLTKKTGKESPYEEYDPRPEEEDDSVTLFANLEKSHILMSFVQNNQVLLQRLFRCSGETDADLNEIFMEMEYFRSLHPACQLHGCVVSGSETDDARLVAELEDMLDVPMKRLYCEPDQVWCMCLGASLTELDFGSEELNVRKAVSSRLGSPWQYVAVALGGAVLVASLMMFLGSTQLWNTELGALRSQQNTLMIQLAESGSAAKEYREYESLYNAYSNDWNNLFNSVRTYNDNACLILEELESVLPASAVVTEMGMTEQSLTVETAFQDKEDMVYFLVALRGLEYAELLEVSDVITAEQWLAGRGASAQAAAASGSALMNMMSQLLGGAAGDAAAEPAPTEGGTEPAPTEGGTEPAPTEGSIEPAPTEGSIEPAPTEGNDLLSNLLANEAALKLLLDGKSQEELLNSPLAEDLTYSQKMTLIQIKAKYDAGTLDPENLTTAEEEAIRAAINAALGSLPSNKPGDTTGGGNTGGNTGSSSGGSLGGLSGLIQGGSTTTTNKVPTGKDLEELLVKYELTEQHLKDGLDNLETAAQMGVLDKHYVELYDTYTIRALLANGATLAQRQTAIRSLLESDALAVQQFFLLLQEDEVRQGKNNVLMHIIREEFWEDPQMNIVIRDSDQAMLDKYLPKLIDMLVKNEETVEGTEALIKTSYNLTRKLAGHLAVAMEKEKRYTSAMDFAQLQDDILTGKTQKDAELDAVVRKLLTPTATEYYNNIQTGSTGSAGDTITDLLEELLGGGTGIGGIGGIGGETAQLPEAPGNYFITVTLGYKPELIQAEQERKGLDREAMVTPPWASEESAESGTDGESADESADESEEEVAG